MCFIINDAAVLKIAVSEEIQMHVAELNSREIKRIHNLGSKNFFKKPQLISNIGYYMLLIRITQTHLFSS